MYWIYHRRNVIDDCSLNTHICIYFTLCFALLNDAADETCDGSIGRIKRCTPNVLTAAHDALTSSNAQ